jgi:predicted dienelactone hydrolase
MLLAACASKAPPKPDEAKIQAFAEKGYLRVDRNAVTTTLVTLRTDGRSVDFELSTPTGRGPFPLVVYLPALGETRAAGELWRTAWAKAGYAVLSIQPLSDDSSIWSSAQARAGDFSDIARERYSADVMTARIETLRYVLGEVVRKHDVAGGMFNQIDPARTAIAGYDMGAYVAMLVAGEKKRNVAPPGLPLNVAAVIALSPFAEHAGDAPTERYSGIHGPVITITSDADTDPLGLVSPATARKTPFENMPGGDKYLLNLSNANHRTFAGSAMTAEEDQLAADARKSGHRQRKRNKDPDGSETGRQDDFYVGGASIGNSISPTDLAIAVAAIENVTVAFLDTYLSKDSIAREWLRKDAARWLAPVGELKIK